MRLDEVSTGERVIVVAGALMFLDSFLPWFRTCYRLVFATQCFSDTAWSNVFSAIAVLVAMVMVAQVVIAHASTSPPAAPGTMTWGKLHVYGGAVVLAFVILQALAGDRLDRAFGLFVGLVLALALAYGGYLRSQEPERELA